MALWRWARPRGAAVGCSSSSSSSRGTTPLPMRWGRPFRLRAPSLARAPASKRPAHRSSHWSASSARNSRSCRPG
eukprot:6677805-Pyramimonas_sp.AAC.1